MSTFESLHDAFARELPELEIMAKAYFRGLNPEARDEAVQNTRAVAWKYWRKLIDQGRAHEEGLLRSVWWYACRHTRLGRSITRGDGQRGRGRQDVYDRRQGRGAEYMDPNDYLGESTPVPVQVAFRIDFPRFLATLTDRQRGMALDLASGMGTGEVAKKHGVTSGAVSQFRTRFKLLFDQFFADAA